MGDSLFTELKRRNVFKVAMAYLVLAWVVVQVTDQAVNAFNMPDWVNTVVFFFGLIGFPFVMLFTWAFELTPEGIKREEDVDRSESIVQDTGKKLNAIIIGLLVIGMGYFIYESRFMARSDTVPEQTTETMTSPSGSKEQQVDEKQDTKLAAQQGSSIAVLPFVNMSSDPEQEYFSDGISEEILNVLAKIPNLHVTSRSSAFSFKGKEIVISEVAQKLGVANVLEGSVRKSGTKVRITAQLIEAGTDKHLWSETYDRELVDIFAIQDEISSAIVTALKEKLGIDKIELKASKTVDITAHEAYLKGRFLVQERNQKDLEKALAEFDKAIAIEPSYTEAWMGKAWANHFLSELNYGNIPTEIATERAQLALDRAMALNSELPENHAIQGLVYMTQNLREQAHQSYEKAIELNPNFSLAHSWYGNSLFLQPNKRLPQYAKSYRLDPVSILAGTNYLHALISRGKLDKALQVSDELIAIDNDHFLALNTRGLLFKEMGQIGKGIYYRRLAYQENSSDSSMSFDYASDLSAIGLVEQAVEIMAKSKVPEWQYYYQNNEEFLVSTIKAKYPRSENDMLGHMFAGQANYIARDFSAAIEQFEKVSWCEVFCQPLMHSYKMLGDEDIYQQKLTKRKQLLKNQLDAGYKGLRTNLELIELAIIEDKTDEAIELLESRLDRGGPIEYDLTVGWHNEPLRQHEKWSELVTRNEKMVKREQQIYLDLVASEGN